MTIELDTTHLHKATPMNSCWQ